MLTVKHSQTFLMVSEFISSRGGNRGQQGTHRDGKPVTLTMWNDGISGRASQRQLQSVKSVSGKGDLQRQLSERRDVEHVTGRTFRTCKGWLYPSPTLLDRKRTSLWQWPLGLHAALSSPQLFFLGGGGGACFSFTANEQFSTIQMAENPWLVGSPW